VNHPAPELPQLEQHVLATSVTAAKDILELLNLLNRKQHRIGIGGVSYHHYLFMGLSELAAQTGQPAPLETAEAIWRLLAEVASHTTRPGLEADGLMLAAVNSALRYFFTVTIPQLQNQLQAAPHFNFEQPIGPVVSISFDWQRIRQGNPQPDRLTAEHIRQQQVGGQ
jgi:hypothetical protein